MFDLENYNFIIDGRTVFHDKEIINDYERLQYILKNLENIDPLLLEQIQFYFQQTESIENDD